MLINFYGLILTSSQLHSFIRSTLLASGFYCKAVKLWNSLPITVAKSNSIGAFKKATIKHFNS